MSQINGQNLIGLKSKGFFLKLSGAVGFPAHQAVI